MNANREKSPVAVWGDVTCARKACGVVQPRCDWKITLSGVSMAHAIKAVQDPGIVRVQSGAAVCVRCPMTPKTGALVFIESATLGYVRLSECCDRGLAVFSNPSGT